MAHLLGRQMNVGIAREATRGTGVAAEYWEKQAELSIDEKFTSALLDTAFGRIENADDAMIVKKWMEGSIRAHVKVQSFGLWLYSLLGGLATAAVGGESVVYDHTITVAQSNQHQSLTISTNDAIQDYRYVNSVVSSLEMIMEAGTFFDFTAEFMGRNGATATNTVSLSTDDKVFIAKHATVKQAADSTGFGAASALPLHRMSLKVEHNIEVEDIFGSITPNDFLNKQYAVTGQLELYFQNESDFKTNALAGTARAIQIVLANTDVTIGTGSNPTITITLYKVKFNELSRSIDNDGLIKQVVSFDALYSVGDTSMVTIVVRNLVADYTP